MQNPEQLFVAQELINKVKSKCCGIKVYMHSRHVCTCINVYMYQRIHVYMATRTHFHITSLMSFVLIFLTLPYFDS